MFKLFAAALILSLVAAPAHAEGAAFVTPTQAQATLILLDPPADGSPEQQAELAALHAIESSRTAAQEDAAKADAKDKSIFMFRTVFGEAFAAKNLPLTAALGEKIARDSAENVRVAKDYFKRIHPYTIDATLHPACTSNDKPESYPSGHAQLGWLMGLTLVEMVPEQREAILLRAQDYGHNRLVCGVHYPSDVAASRPLAYAVHALMTQNPDYIQQVAAARAELRKALALAE
jgi:acid phosphatase (class A)